MRTQVSTKTITEVKQSDGTFSVSCFADKNADGTTTPSIYKSQVLNELKTIDNVNGKEGELMLAFSGKTAGRINEDGELLLEPENDDASKYSKVGENLIYTTN